MSQVSRIGDIGVGTCPCHDTPVGYTTTFITGAQSVDADGLVVTVIGSIGVSSCGHSTVAFTGASFSDANGINIHRVGDVGANCGAYVAVAGSPTTDAL